MRESDGRRWAAMTAVAVTVFIDAWAFWLSFTSLADLCTRQALPIEQVERLVEHFYARVQIDPETTQAVSAMIRARFDEMMAEGAAELADLATETQLGRTSTTR